MRAVCITLLMVSMVVVTAPTVGAQSESSLQEDARTGERVISQETYNRVLDILFPRDEPRGDYGLILRFRPSSHPESQVVIKRGVKRVEVVEYTSLSGNIYMKLQELKSRGVKEDAEEMAKLIKVRRRPIEVPYSQVKRWHGTFLESLGESLKAFRERSEQFDKEGTITVVLDGTFYDLWYGQGMDDISFSFYDEEVSARQPNGSLKVVQWMNAVRRDMEKLK